MPPIRRNQTKIQVFEKKIYSIFVGPAVSVEIIEKKAGKNGSSG